MKNIKIRLFIVILCSIFYEVNCQTVPPSPGGPEVLDFDPSQVQSNNDLHIKYWYYRWRLRENFMKIGGGPGESMIASRYMKNYISDPSLNEELSIVFSDQTIFLGYYLGVLALELKMLVANNQNASQTIKELYYALWAINRLDGESKNLFFNSAPVPNNYGWHEVFEGFFLRDDVDKYSFDLSHFDFADSPVPSIYGSETVTNVLSDWTIDEYIPGDEFYNGSTKVPDGNPSDLTILRMLTGGQNEASQDQIVYLSMGLSLVSEVLNEFSEVVYLENLVPKVFNGRDIGHSNIGDVARRIHLRLISHFNQTMHNKYGGLWILQNPQRPSFAVRRGHLGQVYSYAFARAGCLSYHQTLAQAPCDFTPWYEFASGGGTDMSFHNKFSTTIGNALWHSVGRYSATLSDNVDNAMMANTLCALIGYNNNDMAPYYDIVDTDFALFLRAVLFGGEGGKISPYVKNQMHNLLSTAPCGGPYKYEDKLGKLHYGNINWSTNDRLIHPRRINTKAKLGEYNGLDYMLLHNLYFSTFPDQYPNPVNLVDNIIAGGLPFNNSIGHINNPLTYSIFHKFDASNIINGTSPDGTPSHVRYRAGVEVNLLPGFETMQGATFEALIAPFTCNDKKYKKDGRSREFDEYDNLYGMFVDDNFKPHTERRKDIKIDYFAYDETDPKILKDEPPVEIPGFIPPSSEEAILGLDSTYNNYIDSLFNTIIEAESQGVNGGQKLAQVSTNFVFNVFPNPVSNELNIPLANLPKEYKNIRLRIVSILGQEVFNKSFKLEEIVKINTANLPSGVYLIHLETLNKKWETKFVKS